jgi:membrane protein
MRAAKARARATALDSRRRAWVDRQQPESLPGVAINAWRAYRAVDGPLQSALLSLYVLVAVLPALLVMEEYFDPHPNALATSMVHHYNLNAATAELLHNVLSEGRAHEVGSAFLAIAGALFFGLGFGRVLQLVHSRAWGLPSPAKQSDQARYGVVLLALYGLILLLLVQLTELKGSGPWAQKLLALGWIGLLTHKAIAPRDLLPGAVLAGVGVVVLMLVSSYVMEFWVNWYARDYGGFGVVLAIYFWILLSSGLIIWAAALSPALAQRRAARRAQ